MKIPRTGRPPTIWTPDKLKVLKKLYPNNGNDYVAGKLGTTPQQIRNAANNYGLKKSARYWDKPWEDLLIKQRNTLHWSEIADLLKRKFGVEKTKWAIYSKYRELSLKNATKLQK